MANNLRKFNTYSDYEAAELVKPAVSLIAATDEVYFDQKDAPVPPTPSYLCRLTLNNGETVDIEGSGELTQEMINAYIDTCVSAEIGTACTSIGSDAFAGCTSLTSINIPSGVTSIGETAFGDCTSLSSINIPSGVTSIGKYAFSRCSGITSIDIPDSVTTIGESTFGGCSGLTSVTIGSGVTTIGDRAFQNCTSLTSCTIGSGVTIIYNRAFFQCASLTSITVNATTPPTLEWGVFDGVSTNGVLTVPSGSQGYCEWMSYLDDWIIQGVTCGGSGSGSGSGSGA